MSGNEKNVPERRFKEFENAEGWEQRKLNEIADVLDGDRGNNYPNGNEFQERGHTLFLSASNVTTNGFVFDDTQYITEEKSNSMGNGKLLLDDIVLTSRGSIGHIAWYNKAIQQQVPFARINSGMLILRSKDFIMPCFIAQFLKSPLGKKQIELISFGSAQPQLTKKDVSNYVVSIPSDINEQMKLGAFFGNFDTLVTLHQRKLEKMKALKKAYLMEMFPQEGERKPKLRFAGFTDDWEQRKLGDITSYTKGFAFKSVDYKANGIRIIRVSDLSKDCVSEDVDKIYIDKNKAKQYINYTINNGDIVITTVGSKAELKESAVGRPIIFTENKGYFLNQNLVKIAPMQNYDSQFIYNQLLSERYIKYIMDIQRGNANQANITISDLWEYSFHCPAFPEQKKIGQFFKKLDDTITLHQRKLEKLQNIKKAYLNEMFI